MTTFLAFVFVLGVLVFVHELGHFLAAKRVGIRVLRQEYRHPVYPQRWGEFVPYLSGLDLLLAHGDKALAILRQGDSWSGVDESSQ